MKEKIKLNNGQLCEFDDISSVGHLLTINFDKDVDVDALMADTSIFDTIIILTRGDTECGKFEKYTTIYKRDNNTVVLSDDGSVYVEPVEPEPIPIPEPTLDDVKNAKIAEFSTACNQMIVNGVDVEIGDNTQHFSFKSDDQSNIKKAFDLAVATGLAVPLHCDDGNCTLYSADDMIKIYVAEETNSTHHQTYFNQMKQYIKTMEYKDAITTLNYGDELTGKYLETYNTIMAQAAVIIQAVINGGAK